MRKDTEPEPPKEKKKTFKGFSKMFEKPKKTAAEKARAAINLQFNSERSNPEFGKDFRTSMTRVLAKMSENPDDPVNDVLKILIAGPAELNNELNKVSITFLSNS